MGATNKFGKVAGGSITAAKLAADVPGSIATSIADGLTVSASGGKLGVKAGSIGLDQLKDDDKSAIFVVTGEIDFGMNDAVSVDLGAIGAKATLIGGYWTVTEALADGDTGATIKLGTATGGGSAIAGDMVVATTDTVGMMRAVIPDGTASVDMAATTHLWLDCAATTSRSAGKVSVFCVLQKSA